MGNILVSCHITITLYWFLLILGIFPYFFVWNCVSLVPWGWVLPSSVLYVGTQRMKLSLSQLVFIVVIPSHELIGYITSQPLLWQYHVFDICLNWTKWTSLGELVNRPTWYRSDHVMMHTRPYSAVTDTVTVTVTLVWAYAYDHLIEFQCRRVAAFPCQSVYAYMYGCYDHYFSRVIRWRTAMFALACAALVHFSLL